MKIKKGIIAGYVMIWSGCLLALLAVVANVAYLIYYYHTSVEKFIADVLINVIAAAFIWGIWNVDGREGDVKR